MKTISALVIFLCLTFSVFAQTAQKTVKTAPKKAAPPVIEKEIPETEWQAISDAMRDEKWDSAAALAAQNLSRLKAENLKKQLAQLRYIYIYSLAGKMAEGKITFAELERIASTFVGQEFLLVGRQLLADCNTKVNYICAAKDNERVLRVTATNRSGTAIHSFEYVVLKERFDVAANSEKVAFLGGNLKKVESYLSKTQVKVIRLIFDNGYVKLATD